MTSTLEERDGVLYAREVCIDPWQPREVRNWYQLTMPMAELALYVPDIQKKLGCQLIAMSHPPTVWKDKQGWLYRITSGLSGERSPAFTEYEPIPEPKQRGRTSPLEWHEGAWHKKTSKGLIKMTSDGR